MESNKKKKGLSFNGSKIQGKKDETMFTTKKKIKVYQDFQENTQEKKQETSETEFEKDIRVTFEKIQNCPKNIQRRVLNIKSFKEKKEFLEKFEKGIIKEEKEEEEKDENDVLKKIIQQADQEFLKKIERRQQITAFSLELTPIWRIKYETLDTWEQREKWIELYKEGKLPFIDSRIVDEDDDEEE